MTTKEELIITKYDLLFESRLTKVESNLINMDKEFRDSFREIKTDLRWLLGLMIAFSTILIGAMAKGFHWY